MKKSVLEQKNLFSGCLSEAPTESQLSLVGIADDTQSSYLQGSAKAPRTIREAYDGRCFNACTEDGIDLTGQVHDVGDLLPIGAFEESANTYQSRLESLISEGRIPFIMGGDHAITIPALAAFRVLGEPIQVLQIDAHTDLYPEFEGDPLSHACTATRILEMDHVTKVMQWGIRSWTPPQRRVAALYSERLQTVSCEQWNSSDWKSALSKELPLYVTVDLDGLDPAYAPGVSHPVPGGLTSRQVLDLIKELKTLKIRLVGIDVVEVNPARDVNNQTAILAARILHEAMGVALKSAAIL